jgi:hypothetical protein
VATITETRQALVDAALTADITAAGLTLTGKARPPINGARAGDVFTAVQAVRPASFRTHLATVDVVVVLGADVDRAEQLADALSVPLLDAITNQLACADVEATRELLLLGEGNSAPLYVLTITASTEVD